MLKYILIFAFAFAPFVFCETNEMADQAQEGLPSIAPARVKR
jgi:hypothetical protein